MPTLLAAHGHTNLYNLRNPLWELVFIVCSTLTHEANYRSTFGELRRAFPTLSALASADEDAIRRAISKGGLSRRKARGISSIMDRVSSEFGRPSLAPLTALDDRECESFLTSLPLVVGRKTARCVMLFSLDRAVFPVDTHCCASLVGSAGLPAAGSLRPIVTWMPSKHPFRPICEASFTSP